LYPEIPAETGPFLSSEITASQSPSFIEEKEDILKGPPSNLHF